MKKQIYGILTKLLIIFTCLCLLTTACYSARKPSVTAPNTTIPDNTSGQGTLITPGSTSNPGVTIAPTTPAPIPNTGTPLSPANKALAAPNELSVMASYGEDIYYATAAKKWDAADNILSDLEMVWNTYKIKAGEASISNIHIGSVNSDMASLRDAISDRKQYESALSANKITLDAVNLRKYYMTKVPSEIGEMSYYGRQMLLSTQKGDWVRSRSECDLALSAWSNVKVRATAVGAGQSRSYADTLAKLGMAIDKRDPANSKKYSERMLSQLTRLDRDFSK